MHITEKCLFAVAAYSNSELHNQKIFSHSCCIQQQRAMICTEKVLLAVAVCSSNPFVTGREKNLFVLSMHRSIARTFLYAPAPAVVYYSDGGLNE